MEEKIQRSIQFIEKNIYKKISLNDIAGSVFLSSRHFHRLFKKQTGKSPAKYMEQKKMEKALQLLQQPQILINDIAYTLDYKNYETFSGRFKQHYNISPGDLKSILGTIRLQRNETRKNLNFCLVSSSYKNISEKLNQLKESLPDATEEVEAFVAIKRKDATVSTITKAKYHLSKYDVG